MWSASSSCSTPGCRAPGSSGAWRRARCIAGFAARIASGIAQLLKSEGLSLPRTNRPAGGRYVDCRWPERRITVELDSYRYHHSRHASELDRRREREARARGDEFRRYTYGDVSDDRALMLAELRALLDNAPPQPRRSASG